MRSYLIAIAVFGIGMWLVQVVPSVVIAVQVFGIGKGNACGPVGAAA